MLYAVTNFVRYCLLFIFGPLIEADIKDFVQDWNTYSIHSNNNTASPCGRPDDMYQVPEMFGELALYIIYKIIQGRYNNRGAVNEVHSIDPQLWVRGMLESSSKPALCPHFFEETKDLLLSSLGLRYNDITKLNCKHVYLYLTNLLTIVA